MLKCILEKILIWPDNASCPSSKDSIFWIVWYIASVIFIDGIMTNDAFAIGYNMSYHYFIGMLPLVFAFHDKKYVEDILLKKYHSLLWAMFKHNIVFIGIITLWPILFDYQFGLAPLVRETTITIYWMLSIILLCINNIIIRCLIAVFIYLNCILYSVLLEKIYWEICAITATYLCYTLGGVVLIFILCGTIIKLKYDRY